MSFKSSHSSHLNCFASNILMEIAGAALMNCVQELDVCMQEGAHLVCMYDPQVTFYLPNQVG